MFVLLIESNMPTEDNSTAPVQQWILKDHELSKVLVEIQESGFSVEEQAEIAFHRVTDMYGVPKLPEDVTDSGDGEDRSSVYQELGLIKYLYPENDIRGSVLAAIYVVKNDINIDDSDIDHSAISGLGYKGENSKVELVLVQKDQSWVELGCKLFIKKVINQSRLSAALILFTFF